MLLHGDVLAPVINRLLHGDRLAPVINAVMCCVLFVVVRMENGIPVYSVHAEPGQRVVMSASNRQLRWWRSQQLYSRTTALK